MKIFFTCLALLLVTVCTTFADSTSTSISGGKTSIGPEYYQFKLDSMRIVSQSLQDNTPTGVRPHDFIPFVALLIPLLAIGAVIVVSARFLQYRKIERLAMIEHGYDASMLTPKVESLDKYRALRLGMMFGGLGLGLLVGSVLGYELSLSLNSESFVFSLVLGSSLLGAGLGLSAYYILVRRLEK